MVKLESVGAVHTHTHTHTLCSYQNDWKRICTLLNKKFFARRILLNMPQIEYIDRIITGIDCIVVNVCKKNIYGDIAYPFCVLKNKARI